MKHIIGWYKWYRRQGYGRIKALKQAIWYCWGKE